jgi:hypothetical protein
LISALTTPTQSNKREKNKERNEQKETPTSDRKPNKGKEQDHLKKTSLGPLRQGQRLDTSEKKKLKQRAQTTKPKLEQPQRAPPEPMQLPWTNACKPLENRAAAATLTGQIGAQHVHKTSTLTGQTGDLNRSDRCKTLVHEMSLRQKGT